MALLSNFEEAKQTDIRLIQRNIARGLVSTQEVDRIAKGLPDDADHAVWTSVDELKQKDDI